MPWLLLKHCLLAASPSVNTVPERVLIRGGRSERAGLGRTPGLSPPPGLPQAPRDALKTTHVAGVELC